MAGRRSRSPRYHLATTSLPIRYHLASRKPICPSHPLQHTLGVAHEIARICVCQKKCRKAPGKQYRYLMGWFFCINIKIWNNRIKSEMSLKILEIISSVSPQLEQSDHVQKSLNIWWDYPLKLLKVYFIGIYDIPLTIQWQRCTVYYNRSTSCKMTEAHYADDTVTSFTETEVHLVKWNLVQGRKYIWYSVQKHILCSETYILFSDRSTFCTVIKLFGDGRTGHLLQWQRYILYNDGSTCTSWTVTEVHLE